MLFEVDISTRVLHIFGMCSLRIIFLVFFYTGLYPFFYDRKAGCFRVTKFGYFLKFANGLTYIVFYSIRLCGIFQVFGESDLFFADEMSELTLQGWTKFLMYWSWVQFFMTLHTHWITGTEKSRLFFDDYLKLRSKFADKEEIPVRVISFFAMTFIFEIVAYMAINSYASM